MLLKTSSRRTTDLLPKIVPLINGVSGRFEPLTSKYSFLMVTPSGSRFEFRQTAVSNIYETADSGYTQLKTKGASLPNDPVEEIGMDVTTTDGTVMTYEWHGGAYRCSQIKDRNGNYISITHDEDGTLRTVTDTLGRNFTDTLSNEPSTGLYTLTYSYNLSGGLKSLTDPFGQQFNYVHDDVGRLQSVTGSTAFDGITSYASSPSYTARGTLKGLSYGNGVEMSITAFNNKLQATNFEVKKNTTSYIKKEYQFYADGSLKFVDDMLDQTFDRLYKYDHAGRTVEATAGTAARGQSPTGPHNLDQPYTMAYTHDAFGHITSKTGYYYSSYDDNSYSYTNNRAPNWGYDVDGNTTSDEDAVYGFDAAGHLVKTEERELDGTGLQPPTIDSFDGNGQLVKRVRNFGSTTPAPQTNYFIHSSVLGKLVSEADDTGRKLKTFVPANGVTLAQQQVMYYQGTTERLTFVHQDASTTGTQETNDDGTLVNSSMRSGEYDPLGRNIGSAGPYISLDTNPQSGDGVSGINMFGSGEGYRPGQQSYRIDHLAVPASLFMEEINTGRFGGAFGLLEMAARMSAVEIEWQRTWEWGTTSTAPDGTVRVNTHSLTLTMGVFRMENWAVNLSPFQNGKQQDQFKFNLVSLESETALLERIRAVVFDSKALSEECTKAFQAVGATPIREQLAQDNLRFITESVFMNAQHDDFWAPDQEFTVAIRKMARSKIRGYLGFGPAITGIIEAADITYQDNGGVYKGLRYIGLTNYGIKETLDHFSVTLIHSLLHSGGVKGKDGGVGSDLHYLGDKYDAIIDACQKNKPRVKRAGGN